MQTSPRTAFRKTIAAVLFGLLLFSLAVVGVVQKDQSFSQTEKRVLSSFPTPSFKAVMDGKWTKDFANYVQDQIPLRNGWIGLYAYFTHGAGQNGTDGVYAGADGYLMQTPTAENERNLRSNLRYLSAFAEKTQLPVYLLPVPQTGYVLDDKLPRRHKPYTDDALMAQIADQTADSMTLVDVRDVFRSNRDDTQLYYRTDHHWTSSGAFLAANAFLQAADRPVLSAAQFAPEDAAGFCGTTYAKSGLWRNPADTLSMWHIRGAQTAVTVSDLGKPDGTHADDVFFREHLIQYDMYPVFLNGNHSFTHIVNDTAPDGTLLLLKDSFGNTLATELAAAYREIWMVDMRYCRTQSVSEWIADKHVDTVLVNYGMDSLVHDTNILFLK